MKYKPLLYCLILFAKIFTSCTSVGGVPFVAENDSEFLRYLMDNHALSHLPTDTIDKNINLNELPDSSLIYLMNSHCSACIGKCAYFMDAYRTKQDNNQLFLVVSNNDSSLVDYYCSKYSHNTTLHILRNIENKYVKGNLDDYNAIILRKTEKGLEKYKYKGL